MNKKFTFVSWKWGLFFLEKGNLIFPIELGQRLPKACSQLHVKIQDFSVHTFWKKTIDPRPAQGFWLSPITVVNKDLF